MDTHSSVAGRRSLVWLPVTALAFSILLVGCDVDAAWHPSSGSQAIWKDIARRSGLATGVRADPDYSETLDPWVYSVIIGGEEDPGQGDEH